MTGPEHDAGPRLEGMEWVAACSCGWRVDADELERLQPGRAPMATARELAERHLQKTRLRVVE